MKPKNTICLWYEGDAHDAARHVSTNAADYLGERERGRLQRDAHADIVVMSADLQLTHVFVEGESIELTHA